MDKAAPVQAEEAAGSAPALRRAVRLLDFVAAANKAPTAADITRDLNLPKSSAHGLINAMLDLGLLVKTQDGRFRLGAHPMRWAHGFLSQFDLVSLFQQHVQHHPTLRSFTVTLTVLEGSEVVYVACRQSDQPLGVTFRIGMRLPAAFTATGKALLAERDAAALDRLYAGCFPPPLTSRSVTDLAALRRDLAATRERGYSLDDGEVREGMVCIGAVLYDHTGCAVAGIALSLTRGEAGQQTIERLGAEIRQTARQLSKRLGGL